MTMTDINDEPL